MEDELLRELNAERVKRNVPPVRLVPDLVKLARAHSAEMESHRYFSHDSANGSTYQKRLFDAGILAIASGENISRSMTFLTPDIHQALMDSPPHRENMLNPAYDAVGIGVVGPPGGPYFITVDFMKSFTKKSIDEIRTVVLGALNEARAQAGAPPIESLDSANRLADEYAGQKARTLKNPDVPQIGRRFSVTFVSGIDLEAVASAVRRMNVKGFGQAGVGGTFGRIPDQPQGGYVVCVILVWDGR